MRKTKKLLGVLVFMVCALLLVPNNVDAAEMSDEFKSYLNEDGKLVVKSARVESKLDLGFVFEYLFLSDENGDHLNTGICFDIAEDMNSVDFTIHCYDNEKKETHNVEIVYTYDEKIKSQVDGYLNKIPEDLEYFEVRDLEVINYWLNGGNMINYSSQLKSLFDYKNFKIDFRAGDGARFYTEMTGIAQFIYDGTVYGVRDRTGVLAKHIIYIDKSVGDTEEDVVAAVQKRIDDYLGKTGIEVSYLSTAYEYWVSYHYENTREEWETLNPNLSIEQFEQMANVFIPIYESFEEGFEDVFGLSGISENDIMAYISVPIDEDRGDEFEVIIKKDSSKMVTPSLKTSDIATNVEISTSATLPLDTVIQAKQLTSGTEYERIIEILNLTDNVTFDLKLYSDSTEKYITKLDNGSFEVKIPIPENFEGKDLVVYYVTSEGKIEEHEVTVKDGYAIFKTNHFSIYSLAEKISSTTGELTEEENPKTFDGIGSSIIIGTLSLIGLLGATIYLKRNNV